MRALTLALALALTQPAFPQASPALDKALDSLASVSTFHDVSLSPDGASVAWTQAAPPGANSLQGVSSIYFYDLKNAAAKPRRLTDSSANEQAPAWSADGRLAFLAETGDGSQLQLYVADKPGRGRPRKLTDFKGYLAEPRWSPDGRTIALLHIADLVRTPGPTQAIAPSTGVIGSSVYAQRLALVDVSTGAVREPSPGGMYVYEYDWAPDGAKIVYSAAPGPGDDNWYIAKLYTLRVDSGAVEPLLAPALQMANPRWSPDGSAIAFIGGLMSDEGVTGGDLYALPAAGGEPRNLTPNRPSSPHWFRWLPSSKTILFSEGVSGESAVSTLDVATGSTETLWKGPESISFSGNLDNSAVIRESWDSPQEIWAGPVGKWRQISHANAAAHSSWGVTKSLEWKSDEFRVQGWLMFPKPYDPSKRYPMIVGVHGGPASEIRPVWPHPRFPLQLFTSKGYFLFLPNPRGSYGRGEAFTRANVKDFGYGDLRDILSGVDQVIQNYPVDEKRLGIAGWSYGGYMTMWAVTQTNRFRAAVAGAGLSNWQSYYGENSIDQWLIPYFGASVYDDPAVYAKSSPINFIKNVKTPTLVLVGDRDGECPPPQSYEFWHALKTLGVKTEFVVYPGEGHGFEDPEHVRDLLRRMERWFADNMPPSAEVK